MTTKGCHIFDFEPPPVDNDSEHDTVTDGSSADDNSDIDGDNESPALALPVLHLTTDISTAHNNEPAGDKAGDSNSM